ncbi:hypothetical protein [Catelliglobosispora koreensis]|uniref:hypothetical protein n=1 Tax=Catelliglobosispora koreensis TaxID=129052 RepID=UPI0003602043|nr:hypothetical protein [Catelliglobosispora koreensis]
METKARWIISSGQEVTVGDAVALEFHPDEIGVITGIHPERGLPAVKVTEGPNRGRTRPLVFPSEILMKCGGGDSAMKDYYRHA